MKKNWWIILLILLGAASFFIFRTLFISLMNHCRSFESESEKIESEMGFGMATPYYKTGERTSEVFEIIPKGTSSLFYASGLTNEAILFEDMSTVSFIKKLSENRGKQLGFRFVPSGDGPPLNDRRQFTIWIDVPKKDSALEY